MMKNKKFKIAAILLAGILIIAATFSAAEYFLNSPVSSTSNTSKDEADEFDNDVADIDSDENNSDSDDSSESEEESSQEEEDEIDPLFTVIHIETAEQLEELAKNCVYDAWSKNVWVELDADISMQDYPDVMIPTFGGVFDGNGHVISNVNITDNVAPAGVFAVLQATGVIRNLEVRGTVAPEESGQFIGGIVGENYGAIRDCSFNGTVSSGQKVGGIAGINTVTGRISDCSSSGQITGDTMTGGVTGCNFGIVTNCDNSSFVNTTTQSTSVSASDLQLNITTDVDSIKSTDLGIITNDTGGVVGYSTGIVSYCKNDGQVGYLHVGYNVGGVVGRNSGYILGCSNTGTILGRKDVGGIAGQMEPYVISTISESSLGTIQTQLDELDVLISAAIADNDTGISSVTSRLNTISQNVDSATDSARNIKAKGADAAQQGVDALAGSDVEVPQDRIDNISDRINNRDDSDNGNTGDDTGDTTDPADTGEETTDPSDTGEDTGDSQETTDTGEGTTDPADTGDSSTDTTDSGSSDTGSSDRNISITLPSSGDLSAQSQIDISSSLNSLTSAVYNMNSQIRMLSNEIGNVSGTLSADLMAIQNKISEISDTAFDAIENGSSQDIVVDDSRTDAAAATLGKTADSTNDGIIHGDINIGGIAGSIAMEYELDPEDDMGLNLNGTQRRQLELKAIIQSCINNGQIVSKRNYAGGICGRMDLGLIWYSQNYGTVTSETGNYIGGIAGLTASSIEHCTTKGILEGNEYVGGIVGSGTSADLSGGSSSVLNNLSIVSITGYHRYAGAISGSEAGTFGENYFVSDDLAGINGRSLNGQAQPVTYDQVAGLTNVTVPDNFQTLHLTFRTEDEVIDTLEVEYGTTLEEDEIPEAPEKEGYYFVWDQDDFTDIHSDMDVTAEYYPYITALGSEQTRVDQRAVFIVEGLFDSDDELQVDTLEDDAEDSFSSKGFVETVIALIQGASIDKNLTEQWSMSIPDDGAEEHQVRYLSTEGNPKNLAIYVNDGKSWKKVSVDENGSYLTFTVKENDIKIAAASTVRAWGLRVILAVLIAAVTFMIWRYTKKRKSGTAVKVQENGKLASSTISGENITPEKKRVSFKERIKNIRNTRKEKKEAKKNEKQDKDTKKSNKRKWIIGTGAVAAAAIVVALIVFGPRLVLGMQAYGYLKDIADQENRNMKVDVEATIDDSDFDFTVDMTRTSVEGTRVTAVRKDNTEVYFCKDAIILENGKAYKAEGVIPDFTALFTKPLQLYQMANVTKENNIYKMTIEGEDAKELLTLLMPTVADYLGEDSTLIISLATENQTAARLLFTGSGNLEDKDKSEYEVTALMDLNPADMETLEIPDEVIQTIAAGEVDNAEEIGDDMIRIIRAWNAWNEQTTASAEMNLRADCSSISFDDTMNLYEWNGEGKKIHSILKDGYSIYFTDSEVCTESGRVLDRSENTIVEAGDLLSMAYSLCLNSDIKAAKKGDTYTYTAKMNEEQMMNFAEQIAPGIKKLNRLSFTSGTLTFVIEDDQIQSVDVECDGKITMTLTSLDVNFGATITPIYDEEVPELPEAVKNALVK